MADRPKHALVYDAEFADGDLVPVTLYADRAYRILGVSRLKTVGAGGAGDVVAVTVGGSACASFDLNGIAAGSQAFDATLSTVDIHAGDVIEFTLSNGAGDASVRVYVHVVEV